MTLRGHKRGVWAVAFSPVDQVVATASGDKTIRCVAGSLGPGSCRCLPFPGAVASVLCGRIAGSLEGVPMHACWKTRPLAVTVFEGPGGDLLPA
jgi:hypothetical protein